MSKAQLHRTDQRSTLSHCGGTVPFLSNRIVIGSADVSKDLLKAHHSASLMKELRYDTVLQFDPDILRLTATASKHELSYGSDFPFIPEPMIQYLAKVVRDAQVIKGTEPEGWLELLRASFSRSRRRNQMGKAEEQLAMPVLGFADYHGMAVFCQRVNVPLGPSGPRRQTRTTSRDPSSTDSVPSSQLNRESVPRLIRSPNQLAHRGLSNGQADLDPRRI